MIRDSYLVVVVLLAVACAVGPEATTPSQSAQSAAPADPTMSATAVPDTNATPNGAQVSEPPATASSSSQPPVETQPPDSGIPSRADELGLADIEQLTPLQGAGRRPVLEWVGIPDAAHYHVILLAPSGGAYWGWRTGATSVPVGGLPQLNPGAAGPAISAGMTWSVSAMDAEGRVIGLSSHRPISP